MIFNVTFIIIIIINTVNNHVAMRLFSKRSNMKSKCGKNKKK